MRSDVMQEVIEKTKSLKLSIFPSLNKYKSKETMRFGLLVVLFLHFIKDEITVEFSKQRSNKKEKKKRGGSSILSLFRRSKMGKGLTFQKKE